ncbi:hypothetical protein EYZ11_001459 [Aspergillus tanneri]|uniref:FAD-binding FR-type domain-containing protein n=1 Tax=Aspergillus tanneri TaxID=1220188 RepID=A0A4S3JUL2_9EURO|nr:uncharacterized protein ATNIH1004_008774 [Aspergillus tanneri]KAA8644569.1 hypothetical protein ATNIH1004_008774 [Aspergillus tanneri]THC99063.1 hypothetical protein EYZ11_001459 [Aspergillus tanneri]
MSQASIPHLVRTAAEPRQNRLYNVRLSHVEQANPSVRLLQLAIPPQSVEEPESEGEIEPDHPQPFTFLPGQWLDVYIPSISHAGGFSITSTPADAQILPSPQPRTESLAIVEEEEPGLSPVNPQGRAPYVELAVQSAPGNPASAWLWKPATEIQGKELTIRVGGSFVWPPSGIVLEEVRNVVLVAGGMGINPLISILSHLNNNADEITALHHPFNIHCLYSTKSPEASTLDHILFLSRLRHIIRCQSHSQSHRLRVSLDLFLTSLREYKSSSLLREPPADLTIHPRRISRSDLQMAVAGPDGKVNPQNTVCYVCGPPSMTDELGSVLGELVGQKERVFFEKWW